MSGPMRAGGLGLGGMLLVLAISYFTGQNPADLVSGLEGGGGGVATEAGPAATDESTKFMRVVLGDTEETWGAIFQEMGQRYEPPKLVVFSGATRAMFCLPRQSIIALSRAKRPERRALLRGAYSRFEYSKAF